MVNWEVVKFKYSDIVGDHYRYKGSADNQNSLNNDDVT